MSSLFKNKNHLYRHFRLIDFIFANLQISMKELFIHIGYAKCATTFLQNRLYPRLDGMKYLGRHYLKGFDEIMPMDWVYDLSLREKYAVDDIKSSLNKFSGDSQKSLISHESLLRPYKVERTIERLKSISSDFDKTSIILSVRKQSSLILSRHIHDIQISHFNGSLPDAIDFEGNSNCRWPVCSNSGNKLVNTFKSAFPLFGACDCRKKGVKPINLPYYNYHELFKLITSEFGEGNIHFIITENLRSQPKEEIDRLTNFLEIPQLDELKIRELLKNEDNVTKEVKVSRKELESEQIMLTVEDYFKNSNKELAAKTSLPVNGLDYF